jgi:hypothetical protein
MPTINISKQLPANIGPKKDPRPPKKNTNPIAADTNSILTKYEQRGESNT